MTKAQAKAKATISQHEIDDLLAIASFIEQKDEFGILDVY